MLAGYPMVVEPGQEVTWGELHVGHRKVFEAAGFREVSRPSKRRVVVRIEFQAESAGQVLQDGIQLTTDR